MTTPLAALGLPNKPEEYGSMGLINGLVGMSSLLGKLRTGHLQRRPRRLISSPGACPRQT